MTTAGEIGKARGGCGSRGNRRTLGASAQLLVSGDSRRSHSPATTKIEKKRIESEERTQRPALPGHFSNGRIHHPNPVPQETGYLHFAQDGPFRFPPCPLDDAWTIQIRELTRIEEN